ncbi:P-loop containing nucleoside triphosphate hydrolase protein [Amylostereum chailletii]|nr:P-loop containing nucleoside triphosphate hydrolase protein [Amylostereum chailletii]
MPPKPKNPNPSGLGRAIINRKAKDARQMQESGLYTTDLDSTSRLKSVTQERDLDEFLSTAQLAGTEFTAERRNVKIIQSAPSVTHNPYLLSDQEESVTLQKHEENKQRLRVPRRPPWTKSTTTAQLERQEKDAFLAWRRGLAELQERDKFLLTPFERNIEVWRQLWRVLERSHLIVQIVDARNPLRFRCEDLEAYVQDVEGAEGEQGTGGGHRKNLLLINKSDLLTAKQRRLWADHFDSQGLEYAFFSAANATALQEARREALASQERAAEEGERLSSSGEDDDSSASETEDDDADSDSLSTSDPRAEDVSNAVLDGAADLTADTKDDDPQNDSDYPNSEDNPADLKDPRVKVLSVLELEDLFLRSAPDLTNFADSSGQPPTRLMVGLVGYPNVGKSSTINSLLGEKKVSVSSTPGKTKHFQTINLSDSIVLCDCPGLVFPQFATTRADLVCDGVLPIDQLREYTGPVALVAKRIPREVLDITYGLTIRSKTLDEGGNGIMTAEDLLITYAVARGFTRSGQGNPDEARAARHILKDYVNARLLFCQPPPGCSANDFNAQTWALALRRAAGKKRAPISHVSKGATTYIPGTDAKGQGAKSRAVDGDFFADGTGLSARPYVKDAGGKAREFTRSNLYPHQHSVADDGTPLNGRRARIASVLATAGEAHPGKKHHKKGKRVKQRSGGGYD